MTDDETLPATTGFADLGLIPALAEAVEALGYDEPTPIQATAVPMLLLGGDLLGLAATGTGKTAAFALPMLQRIAAAERGARPSALILVPTRELCRQVGASVLRYGERIGVRVIEVYGGASMGHQYHALKRGVDVVVATPGRAKDHLERGNLDLSAVAVVILDEADEMLDMGFQEDLEAILDRTPPGRQTVLFSATFPPRLQDVARRHMKNPARIEPGGKQGAVRPDIREVVHVVRGADKAAALARVVALEAPEAALVFCRTRADVDQLSIELDQAGTRVEALHGGLSQLERDRVIHRLQTGVAHIVVATDVAARGLDVDRLSHVINVDVPEVPEQYVHRIGRTGRAGRKGVAITLAEPRDRKRVHAIENLIGRRLPVAPVPSAQDLRDKRLERLGERVLETLSADAEALVAYRSLAEDLADELDPLDIAAAALRALAIARGEEGGNEADIASLVPGPRPPEPPRDHPPRAVGGGGGQWARLFVGLGRSSGMRPQDLVGAIAGETRLRGNAIGAIRIQERFSLVEVPVDAAYEVMDALRRTTLRGRRPTVRLDRDAG